MAPGAATVGPHRQHDNRLILWRVSDGKAGHDNQSLGLVEGLGRLVDTEIHTVPCVSAGTAARRWWSRRFPELAGLPDPHLIIGAGHGTHATLLAARRCRGGRGVVLMSPSLPLRCFDLCIVPAHDGVTGTRVITTIGALNRIRPRTPRDEGPGLVLLGGPSRHFVWRDQSVFDQITSLIDAERNRDWILATSRRTPASLVDRLQALERSGFELVPQARTDRDWLGARLAEAARVWVSEDSVSMIYEALTSGAPVGLLALERGHPSRVAAEIDRLCTQGWLARLTPGAAPPQPARPPRPLDEASRCAELILRRWPEFRR